MELRESMLESFIERCREAGLKITPQRVAVYEILLNSHNHPTVEEIYEEVKKRYPFVSLATVYRTVETLEQMGLAKKVCYWGSSARYDANTDDHHHLICVSCGAIRDIYMDKKIDIPQELEGFETAGYSVNVYGLCPQCREKAQPST
ncbi:transcriptional regulator (FurR family) protein [Hydrogenivirga sp. 128-5-R1-1]|nr:transcriptional regulator (FurR family) protein [Hydrogenivirga sp. 128-5-R1-1]